jgi:hypothetical protein
LISNRGTISGSCEQAVDSSLGKCPLPGLHSKNTDQKNDRNIRATCAAMWKQNVVSTVIRQMPMPQAEILHATGAEGNSAAACESLIMAGKQLAKTWPSKSVAEQREFLREVILPSECRP